MDPPTTDLRFPLSDADLGAIPDTLELGSYDRLITVKDVAGGVEEVHSGADSVWLLDPESSPIDAARKALIASQRMLVESLAAPYIGPRLVDFEAGGVAERRPRLPRARQDVRPGDNARLPDAVRVPGAAVRVPH